MQILAQPLPLAIYIAVTALHFVFSALPSSWGRILKCVNLFFHVALYALLMLCRIPLEEVVLLYLFSLLAYLLSCLLWQKNCEKRAENAACSDEREEKA